jgi:uncharacterized iron-regulated membrane protein
VKKLVSRYRLHLLIGVTLFPFLLISSLTGFFRANHKWFWKENYKKVKNTAYSYVLEKPPIPLDSVFSIAERSYNEDPKLAEIRLRREAGRLFYDVRSKGKSPLLIDATNGEVLSPIQESLAIQLASQYVSTDATVKSAYLDENYTTRKEHKPRPVFVVEYADELHTQILLDKFNGEIEEEIDDNLKFGFWMVKLHDYDFWNSKRLILSFVGLGLTGVGLTGFYIWLRKKNKKKKEKKTRKDYSEAA